MFDYHNLKRWMRIWNKKHRIPYLEKYRYAANNDNLIILNQLILKQYIHNMTHLPYNQEDSKVLKNRPDNAYDAPVILKLTQGTIITFERCLV